MSEDEAPSVKVTKRTQFEELTGIDLQEFSESIGSAVMRQPCRAIYETGKDDPGFFMLTVYCMAPEGHEQPHRFQVRWDVVG